MSGQSIHSRALNYGTLPRAPRRPPHASSTLPRPRAGCSPAPPPDLQSLYATLSHPRRSTSTPPNDHYQQPLLPPSLHAARHLTAVAERAAQPLRLDVPPERDWRCDIDHLTVQPSSSWDLGSARHHQTLQRLETPRGPRLCSLCQQLAAEPSRPYCSSCGAYVARFRPVS